MKRAKFEYPQIIHVEQKAKGWNNIKQAVGSGAGTFGFTPTTIIPASSYLIKSTGHITLNITS